MTHILYLCKYEVVKLCSNLYNHHISFMCIIKRLFIKIMAGGELYRKDEQIESKYSYYVAIQA